MATRKYEQRLRAEAAEGTRSRVLEALEERLRQAPSERVSVERVAQGARVSRSALYLIFGSRAGLFDALGAELLRRGGFERMVAAFQHEDPVEGLRGGIRAGVEMYAENRQVLRALFSMSALDEEAVGGAVRRMEDGRAGGMASIAERLEGQGLLRADVDAEAAADVLWVLTSFDAFDLLARRGHGGGEIAKTLVMSAERTMLGQI